MRFAMFCTLVSAPLLPGKCLGQKIIAHRGASHAAPENTLASFRLAWAEGADGIEGDFYLTSDGQIVCSHDASTKRTTGVDLKIRDTSLAELRKLDAGSWKDARYAGQRIPTFAEVAACVPRGKWFFIELKTGPEIVEPLGRELARSKLDPQRTIIICFNVDTLAECRRVIPKVPVQWLSSFKRPDGADDWSQATPTAATIAETARRTGAGSVGLNGNTEVIDAAFVESLRQGGVKDLGVWTIDDATDARYFARLGVFALTTNRPAFVREALGRPAAAE